MNHVCIVTAANELCWLMLSLVGMSARRSIFVHVQGLKLQQTLHGSGRASRHGV